MTIKDKLIKEAKRTGKKQVSLALCLNLLDQQKVEIREMIEQMELEKVENKIKCKECSERFRQKENLKGEGFDLFRFQLLKQLK